MSHEPIKTAEDLYGCIECEWEGSKQDTDMDCCPICGSNCLLTEYSTGAKNES